MMLDSLMIKNIKICLYKQKDKQILKLKIVEKWNVEDKVGIQLEDQNY